MPSQALQNLLEHLTPVGSLRLDVLAKQQDTKSALLNAEEEELFYIKEKIPRLVASGIADDAKGVLKRFLEQHPKSTEAFIILANIYRHKKDWRGVIKTYYASLHFQWQNRRGERYLREALDHCTLDVQRIPHKYKVWMLSPSLRPYKERVGIYGSFTGGEKYQIVESADSCKVLARDFLEPGEIVARMKPFTSAPHILPNEQIYPTCLHCLKERPEPDQSYSCPVNPQTCPFVFCSWNCLMQNVRVHMLECPILPVILAAAKEAKLGYSSVLHIVRTLLKASLEKEHRLPESETLKEILGLPSFYKQVKVGQPELFASFTKLAIRLRGMLPPTYFLNLSEMELMELMIIVWSHACPVKYISPTAFQQQADPQVSTGVVLCPLLGRFHHSCIPTCCYSFDEEGTVTIRALCKIPSGGTLCISVIPDLFVPQQHRKSFLNPSKVFGCGCKRCTTQHENKLHVQSVRCQKCIRGFCCLQKPLSLQRSLDAFSPTGPNESSTLNSLPSSETEIGAKTENETKTEVIWKCKSCKWSSDEFSAMYDGLEARVAKLLEKSEHAFIIGDKLKARKKLSKLLDRFSTQLHPNHYALYSANTILAGILRHNPGKNLPDCLTCLRKAIVAAEQVLPPCHLEKLHLYVALADVTFAVSNMEKLCNRGKGFPPEYVIEPMFAALWNAQVILGENSSITLLVLNRLRSYAAAFNIHTPPLPYKVKVVMWDAFVRFYREIEENSALELTDAVSIARHDPAYPAFLAAKQGFANIDGIIDIFKYFQNVLDLGNGFSLLGVAAINSNLELTRRMLDADFPFLVANEWNITPLLAMAATPLIQRDEGASSEQDITQTAILRLFVKKANTIDKTTDCRTKSALLSARTNDILGCQTALHYAAARGKLRLSMQLIRSGHPVMAQNKEGAVALHLAALCGHFGIVEEMLKQKINVDVKTERGETPLLLAAYSLNISIAKLLVKNGASPTLGAEKDNINIFHAIVIGICRTTILSYKTVYDMDDLVSVVLKGMNAVTRGSVYSLTPTFLNLKKHIELSHRLIEPENRDLFIYPDEMITRLTSGLRLCELFIEERYLGMLQSYTRSGHTPQELLNYLWQEFSAKRMDVWMTSDLRVATFTTEQRKRIEEGWTVAARLVHRISYLLSPKEVFLDQIADASVNSAFEKEEEDATAKEPSTGPRLSAPAPDDKSQAATQEEKPVKSAKIAPMKQPAAAKIAEGGAASSAKLPLKGDMKKPAIKPGISPKKGMKATVTAPTSPLNKESEVSGSQLDASEAALTQLQKVDETTGKAKQSILEKKSEELSSSETKKVPPKTLKGAPLKGKKAIPSKTSPDTTATLPDAELTDEAPPSADSDSLKVFQKATATESAETAGTLSKPPSPLGKTDFKKLPDTNLVAKGPLQSKKLGLKEATPGGNFEIKKPIVKVEIKKPMLKGEIKKPMLKGEIKKPFPDIKNKLQVKKPTLNKVILNAGP